MLHVHATMLDFMIWKHLTTLRGPFRAQGLALISNVARLHCSKKALERNAMQAWEDMNEAGKIACFDRRKLRADI